MQAYGVVGADDALVNVAPCLALVGVLTLPHTLHFQVQEERPHLQVIPAVDVLEQLPVLHFELPDPR
jgi:hypothetical protein